MVLFSGISPLNLKLRPLKADWSALRYVLIYLNTACVADGPTPAVFPRLPLCR